MIADSFYTVLAWFCCQIFKNTCEREREVTPPTIHAVVSSVKLHWHLRIFNFILRLRLFKLNTLSLLSAAYANSKWVYCTKMFLSTDTRRKKSASARCGSEEDWAKDAEEKKDSG